MTLTTTPSLTFKIKGKPAVAVVSIADAAHKWEQYRMAKMIEGYVEAWR